MSNSEAPIFFCIRWFEYWDFLQPVWGPTLICNMWDDISTVPPGCPAVTAPQSGNVQTSLLWSTTSCRVLSGPRETHLHPASAAPVRNLPWCPSVPTGRAAHRRTSGWRHRETRCWTWRAGTSPTTWLKPTLTSSEPGRCKCCTELS